MNTLSLDKYLKKSKSINTDWLKHYVSQALPAETVDTAEMTPAIKSSNAKLNSIQQPMQSQQEQPVNPLLQNNQEDAFLTWYKNTVGKDFNGTYSQVDGLSDKDYEVGLSKYNAYIQRDALQKQYDLANQQIEASRTKQREEASILRDKMAKYIELQNKNNNLDNLGVSESTYLKADNAYMNNLSNIEADANSTKTSLLNNYITNKASIDSEDAANEQSTLNYYKQLEKQEKAEKEEQADSTFWSFADNGYNSIEELEDFYNKIKNDMSENGKLLAESTIASLKKTESELKDKESNELKESIKAGQSSIKTSVGDVVLKTKLNSNANEITRNNSFSNKLKENGFSGPYDSNIPNGTTFEIKCDSSGSDKFDMYDVLSLINPVRTISNMVGALGIKQGGGTISYFTEYVTYYDGDWYISQKK